MATGTGPLGVNVSGVNTTEVTPAVNIESLGDDWGRIAASFERFGEVFKPTLKDQARRRGAEAGAAAARGEIAYKSPALLNEINAEFEDAQRTAFLAGVRDDMDVREREIRGQYLYDPEGYRSATDAMVSGFVKGAPDVLAVEVERYGRQRSGNGLEAVTAATQQRANQEAVATVNARQKSVEEDLLSLAALPDGEVSPEYEERWQEWRDLEIQKVANPLFAYTPEQSEISEGRLFERVQGALLTREASRVYAESGGGPAGYAAARRLLSQSLVDGRGPRSPAGAMTGFAPPVDGSVSSGFGPRQAPVAGASTNHNGVDYAVPEGTPVKAAAPGVVVSVSEDGRSGKYVRIRHPDGTISGYAHLSAQGVKRGDVVQQGAVIGASGSTGTVSGPNLHFTLSRDGKTLDPESVFGQPAPAELAGGPQTDAGPAEPFLSDIPPERRMRLYRAASAEIDAIYAGDRAAAAAEAAEARERAAAEREAADSWRLRLVLGEVTEADIKGATNIDDGTKASLITSARARARTEAREERAEQRAASKAAYDEFRDQATLGSLTEGDLADGVRAGVLTPSQAKTLRGLRDKVLAPVVRDVLAPVRDEASKPGRGRRGTATLMTQAEELAVRWAQENPNATLDQRLAAGKAIAGQIFKAPTSAGGGPAAAQNSKLAKLRALEAERQRTGMPDAEYRRRKKQIMDN